MKWSIAPSDPSAVSALARALNLSQPAARVLWARGYRDVLDARRFFAPSLDDLHDPYLLKSLPEAVERIHRAIKQNEPILLYGDYDVDGTSSVVILKKGIELLGGHVTLVERSPKVHALLKDGLARARAAGPEVAAVVARMTLLYGDAKDLLSGLKADVVIVDPMHPPRKKTALVKKEMRLLRQLVGTDPDALELMQAALASARKRVVLKWPLYADAIEGLLKPSHQIIGKTMRYDVFMIY